MADWTQVGIFGMLLLVAAWGFQAVETIKRRHSGLNLQFDILYLVGSAFLVAYALSIDSVIFAILNALAALLAAIGLYYKFTQRTGARVKELIPNAHAGNQPFTPRSSTTPKTGSKSKAAAKRPQR